MKYAVVMVAVISGAVAQISRSCKNIAFDGVTDVLSADCVPRNQSGYISSGLDLNNCFGYDGTKITASKTGS